MAQLVARLHGMEEVVGSSPIGSTNMFSWEPQFFDIFGVLGFVYIVGLSLLGLVGKQLPKWMFVILLLIGVTGLLIDTLIVYTFYIK